MTRTTIAVALFVAFAIATAVSLHRWLETRGEAARWQRFWLEDQRTWISQGIERRTACLWLRDFLRTRIGDDSRAFEPALEEQQRPTLAAIGATRLCVSPGTLDSLRTADDSLGELAKAHAEAIDGSIRRLETELERRRP